MSNNNVTGQNIHNATKFVQLMSEILSDLTECMAQLGEALSIHLPEADIDRAADLLSKVNVKLSQLEDSL